jgi:pantoate--beta-alanine ligase
VSKVVTSVSQLKMELNHKKVGAVFTMGALHEGHGRLMEVCRELIGADALLVVTIFVNPAQFNDPNDLAKYPRSLEKDISLCESHGVDIVFAPTVDEIYPKDFPVKQISPGVIANILEGESRPGHFAGVATVVKRLLDITQPTVTCFGEKDFQQLAVVKQMVKEQSLAVEVIGVETVRETDGLAMSSRNSRLSKAERLIAPRLYEALQLVASELLLGKSIEQSIMNAKDWLKIFPAIDLDYLTVLKSDLSNPAPGLARILIAARIGDVRLIDNLECELGVDNV